MLTPNFGPPVIFWRLPTVGLPNRDPKARFVVESSPDQMERRYNRGTQPRCVGPSYGPNPSRVLRRWSHNGYHLDVQFGSGRHTAPGKWYTPATSEPRSPPPRRPPHRSAIHHLRSRPVPVWLRSFIRCKCFYPHSSRASPASDTPQLPHNACSSRSVAANGATVVTPR